MSTLLSIFVILKSCSCINPGQDPVTRKNVEQKVKEQAPLRLEEPGTCLYPRTPVTMDVLNLDPYWFEAKNLRSGLIDPKPDCFVLKVVCGNDTLWESVNGWECTHAFFHCSEMRKLVVIGVERAKRGFYKALLKQQGERWKEIPMINVDTLAFEIDREQ
ncbi:signal peptide containing protein [Theileria equi strain WA]|uniref:Signal peptide containing protein n=1 Tax=Theileria equi strain WA TaxID=1537102 RepID=L1LER2_THEEQ|nr:signal peptide containing protein [Theileria equi strain WA]EKX73668.1 signal peptide containing protein [Theileria equi strain WA]|eukprot:XP_004833120.1 signal peptide containing protein [Theileria equi strain WA]